MPGCWVVPPHDTPDARSSQGYNHREALKEVVRAFRAVPADERPARIGGVVKAFQR